MGGWCWLRGRRAWASRRCWSGRPGWRVSAGSWCCAGAGTSWSGRSAGVLSRALLEAGLAALPELEREELLAGPARPSRVLFGSAPDAPDAPASEAGFAILHALYWLVVRLAEREPLVMVVDDAQWVDEPSLRFLVYLLGRLPDQPIALVVAARAGERGEGGLLEQLVGDATAAVRTLAPLGVAAVTRLLRERVPGVDDGFCRRCFELCGGNPLQLRELLAAIEQQGWPAGDAALAAAAELAARSLGRSMLRRLSVLSADARALARSVAVLEDDAPLALAGSLATLAPSAALAAADELAHADLLRAGDPLGFTHPLVRAAVYGQLAFGERAQTHRRAARLLAEMGAAGERVSAHLLESPAAGDEVVVDALRAAARRALAQGVPGSAVSYLSARFARAAGRLRACGRALRAGARGGGGRAPGRRVASGGGDRARRRAAAARRAPARVGARAARRWPADRRRRVLPARARGARRPGVARSQRAGA